MNSYALALSRYKRRKYKESIDISNNLWEKNPKDQSAFAIKLLSEIQIEYYDELENEEFDENINDDAEINNIANNKRLNTSFKNPSSRLNSGRRTTTSLQKSNVISRAGTNSGSRINTSRILTSGGRLARISTSNLINTNLSVDVDKLNINKIAKNRILSTIYFDYLFYVLKNLKKSLELSKECSRLQKEKDWYWKMKKGMSFYHLRQIKDSKKEFTESINLNPNITSYLYLSQIGYINDKPLKSIKNWTDGINKFRYESKFLINWGTVYELLDNYDKSELYLKNAIKIDSINIEAIFNFANILFNKGYFEQASRFFKRLLDLGINNESIWMNLGVCLYYNNQLDIFGNCLIKSLEFESNNYQCEIYYNLGNIFHSLGETEICIRCYKLSLIYNSNHLESLNNLGNVLFKTGNELSASFLWKKCSDIDNYLFEAPFNYALYSYNKFDFNSSLIYIKKALLINPNHKECIKLKKVLDSIFKL